MAAVYSTRFMIAFGAAVDTSWTVPQGKRIVVRSVLACQSQQETGYYFVQVNGVNAWYRSFPAQATAENTDMRLVLFEGDTLGVYTSRLYLTVFVSGYIFADDGTSLSSQGEITRERRVEHGELPA